MAFLKGVELKELWGQQIEVMKKESNLICTRMKNLRVRAYRESPLRP